MKNLYNGLKRLTMIAITSLLFCFSAQAQYALLKSADQQFEAFNFVKAIELYKEAYAKQPEVATAERLAEAYYNIRDYREAEEWYQKAAQVEKAKPENVLRYAEVLQNNTKFREAKAQYERYAGMDPNFSREDLMRAYASCDSAMRWIENPLKHVEINNEQRLNSEQSDFGAIEGPLGLVLVSDRFDGATHPDIIYGWTGNPFLSMYQWKDSGLQQIQVKGMADQHIGSPTFSPDGKEMIFSLTRSADKKAKKRGQTTVNIEIFSAKVDDPDWIQNATPFRYNNLTEWSVGDPFLSNSGDTLYFSSDMPGGYGGTDLYYVVRMGDGSWGEAVNLGDKINTPRNERFPAQDAAGSFYFSSDGHLGMGGLDVYRVEGNRIINLQYPFNSSKDDFSIRFTEGALGYVASNRPGGVGADDVYAFNLDKQIQISLEGTVYNAKTKLPVAGAQVVLTPEKDMNNEVSIRAGEDGTFRFNLSDNKEYEVTAEQVGFKAPVTVAFNTKGINESTVITKDIYLQPVEVKEIVVLRNIYFDFDKYNIRPDAALELDKILSFLNSAPTTKIELSAHTDSRGSYDYNMKLSQNRANSAVEYLVSRGIDRSRLIAKGYGYTRMVNDCGKGVKCSEAEHALNRRVEFVILEE